jgi:hypothetical protein
MAATKAVGSVVVMVGGTVAAMVLTMVYRMAFSTAGQ